MPTSSSYLTRASPARESVKDYASVFGYGGGDDDDDIESSIGSNFTGSFSRQPVAAGMTRNNKGHRSLLSDGLKKTPEEQQQQQRERERRVRWPQRKPNCNNKAPEVKTIDELHQTIQRFRELRLSVGAQKEMLRKHKLVERHSQYPLKRQPTSDTDYLDLDYNWVCCFCTGTNTRHEFMCSFCKNHSKMKCCEEY